MAEVLFITPADITATTILGGNVDPDKYIVNIAFAQLSVIEPLLGTELYDKILADFVADTLTGDYETLFTEYVQPITKHEALAEYIEVSPFMIDNGGAYKHTAENREVLSKDDLYTLSAKYHNLAQLYIGRFNKWICKNMLTEYKRYQDDVNAQNVEVKSGWYFGSNQVDDWRIQDPQ
jgi:hypothetical protein